MKHQHNCSGSEESIEELTQASACCTGANDCDCGEGNCSCCCC
ncbi:hypothetical protein [Pelagicoccus sp. SDUM812003]|nr:hypothetical protein [Pelagicoccus sp. SDUM812003]MDQ8203544.1 hypothetical protein [Pelagicoccus sp. SDUM812003]